MKIHLLINIFTSICSILTVNAYKCNFSVNLNDSKLIRFERDPFDCRVFHICAFNRTYTLSCVKGYYFDSIKNICNFENLVDCHVIDTVPTVPTDKFGNKSNELNLTESENVRVGEISSIVFESMEDDEDDSIEVAAEYDDDDDDGDEYGGDNGGEETDYANEKKSTFSIITSTITNRKPVTTSAATTVTISSTTPSSTTFITESEKMDTTTIEPVVIIQNLTTVPIIIPNRPNNSTRPWWLGPTDCIVGFQHRIPHESNCGKYYECQTNGERVEYACIYPMQFDEFYYECRPYDSVDCGTRAEAKDLCDYKLTKTTLHSIPCYMYPSCKNLTDGLYPDMTRDCRHYFQCKDERTINTNYCPQNSTYGGLKFNYFTKKCDFLMRVSYNCGGFSIPIDPYTNQMICPFGSVISYFSHPSECNIYIACLNGRISTMECPEGTHFSGKFQKCMDPILAKCEAAKTIAQNVLNEFHATEGFDNDQGNTSTFEQ